MHYFEGIREVSALLPLVALVERVLAPSVLLIKSRHLWNSARNYYAGTQQKQQNSRVLPHDGSADSTGDGDDAGAVVHSSSHCRALALDGCYSWAHGSGDIAPSPLSGGSSAKWWDELLLEHGRLRVGGGASAGLAEVEPESEPNLGDSSSGTTPTTTPHQAGDGVDGGVRELPCTRRYPLNYPQRYCCIAPLEGKDGGRGQLRICEFHNYDAVAG